METWGLLATVAEQLKMPLAIISRQVDLDELKGRPGLTDTNLIRIHADAALQLVDSYLLGLELLRSQTALPLEPVSVSSALADTAHDLYRFAKGYGVELELRVAGKYGPVMSHQRGLKSALMSLGFALVETQAAQEDRRLRHITLATHRTSGGIVTGLYGSYNSLTGEQWRTALELCGQARQPLPTLTAGSGAGFFVAETIFRSMETRLRVGRYDHQIGLAVTLQPSRQLQLV
ncbi:MAG TPA: hypothetical protein VJ836_05390 [Candidatus Saccharimonadales bacterium]|nr:hypothetical protein [Candidatus Saccharimonadales bacterium]